MPGNLAPRLGSGSSPTPTKASGSGAGKAASSRRTPHRTRHYRGTRRLLHRDLEGDGVAYGLGAGAAAGGDG